MGWRDALGAEDVVGSMPIVVPVEVMPTIVDAVDVHDPIKKMRHCLHGQWCRNLVVVDDRQVCRRNGHPVFDMEACPFGNWFSATPKTEEEV